MSVYDTAKSKVVGAQESRSSMLKSMSMPEAEDGAAPPINRYAGMTTEQLRAVDVSKLSQQERDQWSAALQARSKTPAPSSTTGADMEFEQAKQPTPVISGY